jgi:hypothetical protein
MEESHRLKQLPANYDQSLFNALYKDTEGLRRKLASQIDPARFGYDYEEILSWFTVKFIYTFGRYYDEKSPDHLRGYIINALKTYKLRLVKDAYNQKNLLHQTTDIDEMSGLESLNDRSYDNESNTEILRDLALQFIKKNISDDAYYLLTIQLDPPPFLLKQLPIKKGKKFNYIPDSLIIDFLGFENNSNSVTFIKNLKSEINYGIRLSSKHFTNFSL